MDSEGQLIGRVIAALPSEKRAPRRLARSHGLRLGIGDDAAVLRPSVHKEWVFSCDAFLEGVHFIAKRSPAGSAGYKSLVRATSDLTAMGATPRFFFLTLAIPPTRTGTWLDKFLKGMAAAATQLGMRLVGGDTTRFPKVMVSITVLGEIPRGQVVTRAGGRPGDLLYVSGSLGGAQLGLELLRRGLTATSPYRRLVRPHFYPAIKPQLGAWLARRRLASAMMDISDGLSTDLARLCAASRVGARLFETRLPCVRVPRALSRLKLDTLQLALHGGEDYQLLFAVPRDNRGQLSRAPGCELLAEIGELTRDKRILLIDAAGRSSRLSPGGWDPFRRRAS